MHAIAITMISTIPHVLLVSFASAAAIRSSPSQNSATNNVCSSDGSLLCNGSGQFGLCNWGSVVWQDVAQGTICQDGSIVASNTQQPIISNYAPVSTACPLDQQWIRPATGISQQESSWVQGRKIKVLDSLSSYLQRLKLESFNVDDYVARLRSNHTNIPTISMAISGGGYGSAFTGTGALRAFDDRFPDALKWRTGGILQSMTYLASLSGSSGPTMSLATHNFPTIQDMVSSWHADETRPADGPSTSLAGNGTTLFAQIAPKADAGYEVGVLELIFRSWGYEFVAGSDGGLNTLVSDIVNLSNFKDHGMPLPIWTTALSQPDDVQYYGIKVPSYNTSIFEMTPFEFGAFKSPTGVGPAAFFPIKYIGTKMNAGKPIGDCIIGYDRATYIMAMASDAANFWIIEAESNDTLASFSKRSDLTENNHQRRNYDGPSAEVVEIQSDFEKYLGIPNTTSIYTTMPNPFAGIASLTDGAYDQNITLLDGSEMGQSIPYWPLIQPARQSDFIISWDNDEDAHPYAWNNGTNVYNSYVYATEAGIPFPVVPEAATFVNRGYTHRPVFFGCEANLTNTDDLRSPIILYLTNAPYSSFTNFSWIDTSTSDEHMAAILTNSGNIVTQGNSTLDSEWPECLGCAMIDRSLAKIGMERTPQCQRCMARYCWDGVSNNTSPGIVDLPLELDPGLTYQEWNQSATMNGGDWKEVS